MADSSWPSTVPDTFEASGFGFETDSGIIRSDMDSGPAKVRRRFTSVPEYYKGTIIMSKSQFLTWKAWFENTIFQGALTFTMTDPIEGGTMTARILTSSGSKPYSISQNGAMDVSLSLTVEKLP